MKRLFIMRHGEAVAYAETDANRALSDKGCQDVQSMVQYYADELGHVVELWASPYLRAQETAEIVSQTLNRPIITQDWLTPTDNPNRTLDALRGIETPIMLVSHQPLVGTLVDRLAGLETGRYRMGTGAIACLEYDILASGCAELLWLHQVIHES